MAANHLRDMSPVELDYTVERAWEKTFNIEPVKKPVPARIKASVLPGPIKRPQR